MQKFFISLLNILLLVVGCSEAFQTFSEGSEAANQMCFLKEIADSVGLEVVNQMHPKKQQFMCQNPKTPLQFGKLKKKYIKNLQMR